MLDRLVQKVLGQVVVHPNRLEPEMPVPLGGAWAAAELGRAGRGTTCLTIVVFALIVNRPAATSPFFLGSVLEKKKENNSMSKLPHPQSCDIRYLPADVDRAHHRVTSTNPQPTNIGPENRTYHGAREGGRHGAEKPATIFDILFYSIYGRRMS